MIVAYRSPPAMVADDRAGCDAREVPKQIHIEFPSAQSRLTGLRGRRRNWLMSALTAPTHDDLCSDLDKVTRLGLSRAQEQSLTALNVILTAVQEVPGDEGASLDALLRDAVDRSGERFPAEAFPLLYGLDGIDLPAKERYKQIGDKLGFSHNTVGREKRKEWNAAVAERLRALFDEAVEKAVGRIRVSEAIRKLLGRLCAIAALQLAAARLPDGSWPSKIGEAGSEGDVSITSWAASALLKVLGPDAAAVEPTRRWIEEHHNSDLGGFGSSRRGDHPPGFPSSREIEPTPRETASAIKILNQIDDRPKRRVGRGIHYLIQHTAEDKGWPRTGDRSEKGHLLTTAYVLDALLAVTPNVRHLADVLDPAEYDLIDDCFEKTVHNGLNWVALNQKSAGGWGNNGESEPYVTAQVICFLHQLITQQHQAREEVLRYLGETLRDGGLPETAEGEPAIGPTAMMVFGLLRGTTTGWEEELLHAVGFLGRQGAENPSPLLDVYSATFTVLLGGAEWRLAEHGWRTQAVKALEAHSAAREESGSPQEVADATLAELPPMFQGARDPLVRILEGSLG